MRSASEFVERNLFCSLSKLLARAFSADGPEVVVLSRRPLPYAEFMRVLREALGVRIGLPATRWMLELGAFLMRTETELILKSRRVVPGRLLEAGFEFEFPTWELAATDLLRRRRDARLSG